MFCVCESGCVQSQVSLVKWEVGRDAPVTERLSPGLCEVLEKERKGVKRKCLLVHARKERKGRSLGEWEREDTIRVF